MNRLCVADGFGKARRGGVWQGRAVLTRRGKARHGLAWHGRVRIDAAVAALCDKARRGLAGFGMVMRSWLDEVWRGATWRAQFGHGGHGCPLRGEALPGQTRRGVAGLSGLVYARRG